MSDGAVVVIGGEEFRVPLDEPFVFGRSDNDGVLGLDPNDMGISAVAGAIQRQWDVWWVVNRSAKRHLLMDAGRGAPVRVDCGQRLPIAARRVTLLVPGVVFTHRLDIMIPERDLLRVEYPPVSSGTITADRGQLTERDRLALVGLFSGYLEDFPRRNPRPSTYEHAADLLGAPWTKVTVRKQVERVKSRFAKQGIYFEGSQGNLDLADYVVGEGIIGPEDLSRIKVLR